MSIMEIYITISVKFVWDMLKRIGLKHLYFFQWCFLSYIYIKAEVVQAM